MSEIQNPGELPHSAAIPAGILILTFIIIQRERLGRLTG